MVLLLKAVLGAGVVLILHLCTQSKHYYLAGLVPLFPTFALISHYIVGAERSTHELQTTILFGIWALIPYWSYLVTLYVLVKHLPLMLALGGATCLWVGVAAILLMVWNHDTSAESAGRQTPSPLKTPILSQTALVRGYPSIFQVTHVQPGEVVVFLVSETGPSPAPCAQAHGRLSLDLSNPQVLGKATADASGIATLQEQIPVTTRQGHMLCTQAIVHRKHHRLASLKTNIIMDTVRSADDVN